MTTEMFSSRVLANKEKIIEHLEHEKEVIKDDYLEELEKEFKEEMENGEVEYANFKEFLEDKGDDYVDFAFKIYLERLISQLCEITQEEIEAMPEKSKWPVLKQFYDYFKEVSGLGSVMSTDLISCEQLHTLFERIAICREEVK